MDSRKTSSSHGLVWCLEDFAVLAREEISISAGKGGVHNYNPVVYPGIGERYCTTLALSDRD